MRDVFIGEVAKEEETWMYKVVLPWGDKSWMKVGDRVELIDSTLWSLGMFTITKHPDIYRLPNWIIENITLTVKQSQNELQPNVQ
jgi:hypothetical protein